MAEIKDRVKIEGARVTKLEMRLASGTEDSTASATLFDPAFCKYLDSASRFELPIVLAGKTFTFQASCESYDFDTLEVTLTGNSPAWQSNLVRRYRVMRGKTVEQVFRRVGVGGLDSLPASVLSQEIDVVQNYVTDYQFAVRLSESLGLRVAGDLQGGGVKVLADAGTVVLAITGEWTLTYANLKTDEPGILVSALSFRHADVQDSAKAEPGESPEVATEDSPEQTEPKEKYLRINPLTGERFTATGDALPVSANAKAKAKARAIEATVDLVVSAETEFLAQPGDAINLTLKDPTGQRTELSLLVDTADYRFQSEFTEVSLTLKTKEA